MSYDNCFDMTIDSNLGLGVHIGVHNTSSLCSVPSNINIMFIVYYIFRT